MPKNLNQLPESKDEDFWPGEKHADNPVPLNICSTHTKETWADPSNKYVDNHDGTVTCVFCPQGYRLPGYMRCIDGKIVDLRDVNRAQE